MKECFPLRIQFTPHLYKTVSSWRACKAIALRSKHTSQVVCLLARSITHLQSVIPIATVELEGSAPWSKHSDTAPQSHGASHALTVALGHEDDYLQEPSVEYTKGRASLEALTWPPP